MDQKQRTRRRLARRASEMSLGGDKTEVRACKSEIQAAWLAARFNVGAAHARVLAEHVFAARSPR